MWRRFAAVGLGCVAVLTLALVTAAADRPSVAGLFVSVLHDTDVAFTVVAEDPAIDPANPGDHALRLVVLDGPAHGVLVGDLEAAAYESPHRAVFSLTYAPGVGFVGRDVLVVIAVDALGDASTPASIELDVVAERPVGRLAGSWDAEWTINVQSAAITAFTQRLTEAYRVGSFVLKSIAEFQMESTGGPPEIVFDALRFESEATVGRVQEKVALAFDPKQGEGPNLFDYFLASTEADLFGVSLDHLVFLTRPQTESYQTLSVSTRVGGLSLLGATRFDLGAECGFTFSRCDITATWAACDATLRAAAAFTNEGFQSLTFSAVDVPLPRASWLPGEVTVAAAFTFKPTSKTLSLDLDWDPGAIGCVRLLGGLVDGTGPDAIGGVSLYGLVVDCDVSPGVLVTSATSLDPAKNALVTGQVDYFEVFRLSGDLDLCCGVPGAWSVATYFRAGASQLFDWGMTLLKADLGISEHWSVRLDVAVRSGELGDPVAEFTIGWTTRW